MKLTLDASHHLSAKFQFLPVIGADQDEVDEAD